MKMPVSSYDFIVVKCIVCFFFNLHKFSLLKPSKQVVIGKRFYIFHICSELLKTKLLANTVARTLLAAMTDSKYIF